jgi:predicted lipoprotein with Yx(FWY)xxD motif
MQKGETMRRVIVLVAIAACGGSSGAALELGDTGSGSVLVDGEGMTLYMFANDNQGDSTCYDQCAENWPPFVGEVEVGDGVDQEVVGSVERTDGTSQVTYNGWPLYRFAADTAVGDVNGQGVNDVWFVMDGAGTVIRP